MLGYRCLINHSGYCQDPSRQDPYAGDPACSTTDGLHVLRVPPHTSCTLDPRICGFFITWKEKYCDIQPIEEYRTSKKGPEQKGTQDGGRAGQT
ncbi:hypothetical protein ES705_29037 [subsurface metagenome]